MKDIRTVSQNTTAKAELLENQLKDCSKFLTAIDSYVSDTQIKIDAIRGMFLTSLYSFIHSFIHSFILTIRVCKE